MARSKAAGRGTKELSKIQCKGAPKISYRPFKISYKGGTKL